MSSIKDQTLNPRFVRLDASTICQLKCPSCPTASGATGRKLGVGYLKFEDFKEFIRRNSWVSHVELSNWGEVFLNKDLIKILAHAYRHNVCLYIANGANLNSLQEDTARALVRYKLRRITCSIDGASQESYVQYRINGNFGQVIENIKMINHWKAKYSSPYPQLTWQFVAFGHNEHEIVKARDMAKSLDMSFYLKLSWSDLYDLPDFSPVQDKKLVGRESGLNVSSRKEYKAKYGQDYAERSCCWELWNAPQINFDGRMLGCPINYGGDYGNAFEKNLETCLNGEKIRYARDMLMGKEEPREGIPCTTCKVFHGIRQDLAWVTEKNIQGIYYCGRRYTMFENKILGEWGTARLVAFINQVRKIVWRVRMAFRQGRLDVRFLAELIFSKGARASVLPNRGYPLSIPLPLDQDKKWKPNFLFRGLTKNIQDFSCHVSFLTHGHCPHPPHAHKEEEILIMLTGEAELSLPLYHGAEGQGCTTLKTGEFVYYPSEYPHTLQTTSESPANYLMFKWCAPNPKQDSKSLSFGKYKIFDSFPGNNGKPGFQAFTLLEGRSSFLARIHCHVSVLSPGASYPPHVDVYDVAIVILEGEVETLGERFAPYSVIFYPSGQRHGMLNPGKVPAKYIVFEFQS